MLTNISIENFKGIGEKIELDLAPITLLFGANSAGKSSIIHALHYAREVLFNMNTDADITETGGNYVNLGGFDNLLHGRNDWRQNPSSGCVEDVRISLCCDIKEDDTFEISPYNLNDTQLPNHLANWARHSFANKFTLGDLDDEGGFNFSHRIHSLGISFTVKEKYLHSLSVLVNNKEACRIALINDDLLCPELSEYKIEWVNSNSDIFPDDLYGARRTSPCETEDLFIHADNGNNTPNIFKELITWKDAASILINTNSW
ncbi:MAG: AAA family ATPase, partial [Planctomycetaceae bacterium]|nr:AAA family ATPase [Planctomycetaceae bacterium]